MLIQSTYSFELPNPITIDDFIKAILSKANVSNIECTFNYNHFDTLYFVLQRIEPSPNNLPEFAQLGTNLIMTVQPKIVDRVEFYKSLNEAEKSPGFNKTDYVRQMKYNQFIIKVERKYIDAITHNAIEQVEAELRGI